VAAVTVPVEGPDRDRPARLRRWVSVILLIGVAASVAISVVGTVLLAVDSGGSPSTDPIHLSLRSFGGDLLHGDPYAVLWLGLLILVVTPLARVIASVVSFAHVRDGPFVAMTLFVLAVLLATAVAGVVL